MMLCKIPHHHYEVETVEGFVALCIIILIMLGIAAIMDYLRKQKVKESTDSDDIEISIKIKFDEAKNRLRR